MEADALAAFLVEELGAAEEEAEALVPEARGLLRSLHGDASVDDDDVDLLMRLQEPRALGLLAARSLAMAGVGRATRLALVHRAFDIIPLPEDDEVLNLDGVVPGDLQTLLRFLLAEGEFTPLHFLHALYSLFLVPSEAATPAPDALPNLQAILPSAEYNEAEKVFYGLLLVLALGDSMEAPRAAELLLDEPSLPGPRRCDLALNLAAGEGIQGILRRLAVDLGLLPSEGGPTDVPALSARPAPRVAALAARWASTHGCP
jgi:hypothetical protein